MQQRKLIAASSAKCLIPGQDPGGFVWALSFTTACHGCSAPTACELLVAFHKAWEADGFSPNPPLLGGGGCLMGLSGMVLPARLQVLAELFVRGICSRWRAGVGVHCTNHPSVGENKRRMSREH